MRTLATYYPFFDIKGKNEDEIFRQLCIDKPYKRLNELTWKESFINNAGILMKDTPDPRGIVARILNRGLAEKRLPEINPETIYFNTFLSFFTDRHFVFHRNSLNESYRVTDACLMNIFVERYRTKWGELDSFFYNGIYSVGKEGAYYPEHGDLPMWGPNEEVFPAKLIADILYDNSVWDEFRKDYILYWGTYNNLYADILADTFLATAVSQYKKQTLTDEGFLMVRNAYYGIADEVQVTLLDIYGYASTDIICIEQKGLPTSRVVLYIPGGRQPFTEFLNLHDLKQWIFQHLKDQKNLEAFRKHFSLLLRQDGVSFTGVDKALQYMLEESPSWPFPKYILYKPIPLNAVSLFEQIRDRTRERMYEDGDVQIKSNEEAARDFALFVLETLMAALPVVDILVPELSLPLNFALSCTTLGLSSDIVVNGDSYEERKYGLGSLVGSAIFVGMNMLAVISESANILKNFDRTIEELPTFLTDEEFLASHFGLNNEELAAIAPGDAPTLPAGSNPQQVRLVRISDENQQLAALRRLGGNKFVRLNPITLEDMEGALVSEVLDPETGKFHYLTNGRLIGGSPYSPFRAGLEGVWTPEVLKAQAIVPGKIVGPSYKNILDMLEKVHASDIMDQRQGLMHELMELIDNYEAAQPTSGRLKAFRELRTQLEDSLYTRDMYALKAHTLSLPNKGSGSARFLLRAARNEMAGNSPEITANLIRFAREDSVISSRFAGYGDAIPQEIDFEVKYVIKDLSIFDKLPTSYYNLPAYESWGSTSNSTLMPNVLRESQNMNLLTKCRVIDNSLYIGHSYEEMFHSISGYANRVGSPYELHPLTFFNMLEEAHKGIGFEPLFATRQFFNETVTGRLSLMENSILLSDEFNFLPWDVKFGNIGYQEEFAAMGTNDRIALCMQTYQGVAMESSAAGIDFFLDNLPAFIENGMTDIAVSDLPYELAQTDITRFLQEKGEWQVLDSMLLNLDKGKLNGPFRRLLQAAKDNDLNFTAIGHADNSVSPFATPYKGVYYKGSTIQKAIQHLDQEERRFVVFADPRLINSTPGADMPMPGLAQYLNVPGTAVDSEGAWNFVPDVASGRVAIEAPKLENWNRLAPPRGKILGLKQFRLTDGVFPTDQIRSFILEGAVPQEQRAALKKIVARIHNDPEIQSLSCSTPGSCDSVSGNIFNRLREMEIEPGTGASVTWWKREGGLEFSHNMHTTASFKFNGKEFAVDATHLQFIHDIIDNPVLVLPIDDWAIEIARRNRAINPFLDYTYKRGNALAFFMPPAFTKPILHRL